MWINRIDATYKLVWNVYVTRNVFEICAEFVRIPHTLWRIRANNSHVWKIRSVNLKVQNCFNVNDDQFVSNFRSNSGYSYSMQFANEEKEKKQQQETYYSVKVK